MNKKDKQFSFVNIGLSSLLVIFLVLCLTTFALLSLSSAKSDYSLSEKMADHVYDYYQASAEAEEIVAQLDELMSQNRQNSSVLYTSALSDALEGYSYNGIDITFDASDSQTNEYLGIISFSVPLDDRQELKVKLGITDPTAKSNYYDILEWQTKTKLQQEMENTLNLLPVNDHNDGEEGK